MTRTWARSVERVLRRSAVVLALLCVVWLVAGCSTIRDLGRGSAASEQGTAAGGCAPSSPAPARSASGTSAPTPTPTPTPTLDPQVAGELGAAVDAVRALPAVDLVDAQTSNGQTMTSEPGSPGCAVVENHFVTEVTVTMSADATPAQAGAVPTTMAAHLAWTGVSLALRVPPGSGHIGTVVHYTGTFDQTIPIETATDVARGLSTLAATPHVSSVEASIPYTMRVDYGSLTVGVDTSEEATLDGVRAVIETTIFRDTTLHGSFHNGAKP